MRSFFLSTTRAVLIALTIWLVLKHAVGWDMRIIDFVLMFLIEYSGGAIIRLEKRIAALEAKNETF